LPGCLKWGFLFTVLVQLSSPVSAEQLVRLGSYEIHYSAISSTLIPAPVAAKHGLVRAENRVITNIAIRTSGKPVAAVITGTAENILNQRQPLDFHEVIEQEAIYYLAEQIVNEKDIIRYNISIQPTGSEETYEFAFQRQYY
jgi:hypothetical protein